MLPTATIYRRGQPTQRRERERAERERERERGSARARTLQEQPPSSSSSSSSSSSDSGSRGRSRSHRFVDRHIGLPPKIPVRCHWPDIICPGGGTIETGGYEPRHHDDPDANCGLAGSIIATRIPGVTSIANFLGTSGIDCCTGINAWRLVLE